VSIGKLSAQMETLTATMTTTVQQFTTQSQGLARIETQVEAIEERMGELRKSLYGSDGSGGMVNKISACENTLLSIQKEIAELRKVADEFKKTLVKIVVLVISSGALSGGAAAKLLGAFAP
tara:strand:+ start:4589 stop:4951 length:363 start_codon:yes stop_codon:yes gene_type:complete